MAITDIAGNPLAPATLGQMLGFVEVSAAEVLTLDMYRFLHQQIRTIDEKDGNLFVRRLFDGAQDVWEITQGNIFDIKKLWSITEIPDDFLQFLKNIVGWTKEKITKRVTDDLDDFTLRRLISLSAPLWKKRGPEDTIIDILQALTGQRLRIWNWFDLRWVLDETEMSEDHAGRDPFVIELPQDGTDEYRFNVRIVDPGDLNRELVVNVVKIMRPVGERIEISYLAFLDRFQVKNDNSQWGALTGGSGGDPKVPTVTGGVAKLTGAATESSFVVAEQALEWAEYIAFWRIRSTTGTTGQLEAIFYATDLDNDYRVVVDFTSQLVRLRKQTANAFSQIGVYVPTSVLTVGEWFGIRIHVAVTIGGTNQIKVYLDGDEIIDVTDSDHTEGSIGFGHTAGVDAELDEAEIFEVPLQSDTVDINAA